MKKKFLIIIGVILVVIVAIGVTSLKETELNDIEDNDILSNNKESSNIIKEVNGCIYKHFVNYFSDEYHYSHDMKNNDGIYYKIIDKYDDYLICKERWNSILNMEEKDFENNFMIITAVENESTADLTVSDIFNKDGVLYVNMDDGEKYYPEALCISIIIPNDMKGEEVIVRDIRKE